MNSFIQELHFGLKVYLLSRSNLSINWIKVKVIMRKMIVYFFQLLFLCMQLIRSKSHIKVKFKLRSLLRRNTLLQVVCTSNAFIGHNLLEIRCQSNFNRIQNNCSGLTLFLEKKFNHDLSSIYNLNKSFT